MLLDKIADNCDDKLFIYVCIYCIKGFRFYFDTNIFNKSDDIFDSIVENRTFCVFLCTLSIIKLQLIKSFAWAVDDKSDICFFAMCFSKNYLEIILIIYKNHYFDISISR